MQDTQAIMDAATASLQAWRDARIARGDTFEIEDIRVRPTTRNDRFGAVTPMIVYARATCTINGKRQRVYVHVFGNDVYGTWRYN